MKPEDFDKILGDPQFRREDPKAVENAAASLGTSLPPLLLDFYKRFRGPLGSDVVGYQLLDIAEDYPTVLSLTADCRRRFDFPSEWVVISDLHAGAVLVLDCKSNCVYDVDFEGGVELFKGQQLEPRWKSVDEFFSEFFQVRT